MFSCCSKKTRSLPAKKKGDKRERERESERERERERETMSEKLTGLTLKPVGAPSGSRSMEDCYDKIAQVGEGMYGQVYKMRDKADPKVLVALKKVRMANEREGFPITAIREIKLLSKFSAENDSKYIVNLKEIVTSKADAGNDNKGDIYMVFEYMQHDLAGIRENKECKFDLQTIKVILKQILRGLWACHKNKVLHRDLKCSNVLVNVNGEVKLADFGLARTMGDKKKLTPKVITLWYRPPELLLGNQEYGPSVDMWSAGCILAELLLEKPLLPGKDESDQIFRIFQIFGTPGEETWPGVTRLPLYERYAKGKSFPNIFSKHMLDFSKHKISENCLDLLLRLLDPDPKKRITANEAYSHEWFSEGPRVWNPNEEREAQKRLSNKLHHISDSHEYEQRLKRKLESKQSRPMAKPRFM